MRTALVTVAHGRHEHLQRQHAMVARSTVPVEDYVVVAVDDPVLGSIWEHESGVTLLRHGPGRHGLPIAAARNAGAAAAVRRGAELIIFLDVDCLPDPELVALLPSRRPAARLGAALRTGRLSAPTRRHRLRPRRVEPLSLPPGPAGPTGGRAGDPG